MTSTLYQEQIQLLRYEKELNAIVGKYACELLLAPISAKTGSRLQANISS